MWDKTPEGEWTLKTPVNSPSPENPKGFIPVNDQVKMVNEALAKHANNPEALSDFLQENRNALDPNIEREANNWRASKMWQRANAEHTQTADVIKKLVKPALEKYKSGLTGPNELYRALLGEANDGAPIARLKPYMNPDQWEGTQNSILNHILAQSSSDGMLNTSAFSKNLHGTYSPLVKQLAPGHQQFLNLLDQAYKRASLNQVPLTAESRARLKQGETLTPRRPANIFEALRYLYNPVRQLGIEGGLRAGYYGLAPHVMNALEAMKQNGFDPSNSTPLKRALTAAAVQAAQGNLVNQEQK
jgi:hypothetical protein